MNLGNRDNQVGFATIPDVHTTRSIFDRSHAVKTTIDFDYLVPCIIDEILPGDTVNLTIKSFARLAPQVRPLMDNMYLDFQFFFVPARLVWDNWEKFMGERKNPSDSIDFLLPQITNPGGSGYAVGSIYDQMGIPTGVAGFTINALPFRAYNLIWNEWYRDQNLQNSLSVPTGNGPDTASTYTLQKRAKKHDYFTSCLSTPQKGAAVTLPLGTSAPITLNAVFNNTEAVNNTVSVINPATGDRHRLLKGSSDIIIGSSTVNAGYSGLSADLSAATSATINQLRLAFMTQSLLELDMRGGTRYIEILRAHFNVISPDFRLQRPEILSAASTRFAQHPLTQTSETTGTGASLEPLGQLSAFSTNANLDSDVGFSKSFQEHGYIIGLVSARADITYQQGLHRMWSRSTRYDFFWPKLQELGEQAVLSKEIFIDNTAADNDAFGYQERYAEYKYKPSEIRGQFRSTFAQSLDVWHLAEEFGSRPLLNSTFIQSETPIERALQVPDPAYPHILLDMWIQMKHIRPIMAYSTPATLGRF